MKTQRGFNLVELAIVMVIIGLLLGGVLKGQALVTSAKIKKVNNDFNGVTAAIYTYLDRYNALPGDDARATARWGLGTSTPANPDGTIDGGAATDTWQLTDPVANESALVWLHLRSSDLVAGSATLTAGAVELPSNPFDGTIGVQDGPIGMSGTAVCMSSIPGDVAEIIDINFDDGIRNTGLLQSIVTTADSGGTAAVDTTPADGVYVGDATYSICKRI